MLSLNTCFCTIRVNSNQLYYITMEYRRGWIVFGGWVGLGQCEQTLTGIEIMMQACIQSDWRHPCATNEQIKKIRWSTSKKKELPRFFEERVFKISQSQYFSMMLHSCNDWLASVMITDIQVAIDTGRNAARFAKGFTILYYLLYKPISLVRQTKLKKNKHWRALLDAQRLPNVRLARSIGSTPIGIKTAPRRYI